MGIARAKSKVQGKNRRVSSQVAQQFPAYFREEGALLVDFIKAYYEWTEEPGKVISDTYQLTDFMDIDKTDLDRFGQYFRDEFLPSIPEEVLADKRLLVKHIKQFYRSRGSVKSFEFLFRIMYGESIEIYYPSESILRTSDGVWLKRQIMRLQNFDTNISHLAGRKIYGLTSGASAIVDNVTLTTVGSYDVAQIEVIGISGVFAPDEAVETRDPSSSNFPYIISRVLGQITSFVVESAGTGYSVGDFITMVGGDGEGAIARISSVGLSGEIKGVRFIENGVGYSSVPPTADLSALSGSGGQIRFNISSIFFSPGEYLDDRGQPSSTVKLQDGKFYQDYSYVIKSSVAISKFRDIVNRLVHPAGMGMFSETTSVTNVDDYVGFGGKILFHLSHPDDENFNDPNYASSRKFFEPEIIKESQYMTFDLLQKQNPAWTIGDILDKLLNAFWSVLTPRVRSTTKEIEMNGFFAQMARREADTYIGLYADRTIAEFESMLIGDIEPYTQYPNARNSYIQVIGHLLINSDNDKLIINSNGDFLRVTENG